MVASSHLRFTLHRWVQLVVLLWGGREKKIKINKLDMVLSDPFSGPSRAHFGKHSLFRYHRAIGMLKNKDHTLFIG